MFEFKINKVSSVKADVLSGLTVALALVPEAVAFAFVAGVAPLVGLHAAFMVGLITAVFGGRPGMISGATGALAVVMVSLVADHGIEYLFAAVVLMGIIQLIGGWLNVGRFIRMVPHPVMLGFVNGLAIVIFLAQLSHFSDGGDTGWLSGSAFEGSIIDVSWMPGNELGIMIGLVLLTMAIIHFLPKLTTAIPSSLAAIITVTLIVVFFSVDTRTVGDVASIEGGFPEFHIPQVPLTFETLQIIFPYSLILATIGLIESMLTLRLVDEVTETVGQGRKESFAQGAANFFTGLFSGMGGCAMIGQSMINVNSGGRGRLSGITAAVCLLLFILVASPLIEQIPIAALVGVMFIVVLGTFEWSSFRIINKIPRVDAFVLILVSSVTVATDLAVAVVAGVIVSALAFAWHHAKHVKVAREHTDDEHTYYRLDGALFFASVDEFVAEFKPKDDHHIVIIDFERSRIADHSAMRAIRTLSDKYIQQDKKLHLLNLSIDCRELIEGAGPLISAEIIDDHTLYLDKQKTQSA
ncbi:MAG: SulP family inorganic anion transporter [Pseudomonadota bacterium]